MPPDEAVAAHARSAPERVGAAELCAASAHIPSVCGRLPRESLTDCETRLPDADT